MSAATFSLHEVATEMRLYEEMRDPVRWLTKQIKDDRITAARFGRSWRMTRAQIDAALDTLSSKPQPTPKVELQRGGLSAASMKRRVAA
jgi:hypothetical protein